MKNNPHIEEIINAARKVVDRWSKNSLAEAVRELDLALADYDEAEKQE